MPARSEPAVPPIPLTWDQVGAWRLARHALAPRRPAADAVAVVSALGGLQAQVLSSAEGALAARVDGLRPGALADLLWEQRALVKTWAMRGTLHALPAADYPRFVAALRGRAHMWRPSWLRAFGVSAEDLAAVLAAIPEAMDGRALTREALAGAVESRAATPHLGPRLRSGWGELLKPAAYTGALCFGPPNGSAVTFVRPDQWLAGAPGGTPAGADAPDDPTAALAALLRGFLAAYGPATVDDFAHWWGSTTIGPIRAAFAALAAEIVPVAVEGWAAWALAGTLPAMQAAAPAGVVRLLPGFDPYVITLYHQPGLLDRAFWPRVSRTSGWISPVLLVDGRLAGVWSSQRTRGRLALTITPFAPVAPAVVAGAAAEADRLGAFLDAPVDVTWEPPAPA